MATRYLIDTNVLTAMARRDATVRRHIEDLTPSDLLCSCFVVLGEWEYGILNASGTARQAELRAAGRPVIGSLRHVWQSTPGIVKRYGAVSAALRASGELIPTNDIWIAATALARNAILVTSDPHFARVPGLKTADWTKS